MFWSFSKNSLKLNMDPGAGSDGDLKDQHFGLWGALMTSDKHIRILIDAREFVHGRVTGIARVLQGLTASMANWSACEQISLAVKDAPAVPSGLRLLGKVSIKEMPSSFLNSEKALSNLSRHFDLYISPYPKLPLFGVHCPAIHIIHDVLDLTHPLYKTRFKTVFDRYRLKKALNRADLTWYDSSWSMLETAKSFGFAGNNPRVRYPGIDKMFKPEKTKSDNDVLSKYGLHTDYVLALGNGLPHKNLGIILDIAHQIERPVVFAGIPDNNRQYWESRHPGIRSKWIRHVEEQHLPALMRGAFCLVQPSLVEGYGYPPLEAMACGVPVLVSDIPVLLETTGGNALAIDPADSDAWIGALLRLEDQFIYEHMRNKGLEWVSDFRGLTAWDRYLNDLETLLNLG
jgi:glycosyltransferase involved in cell wall biosynthesis